MERPRAPGVDPPDPAWVERFAAHALAEDSGERGDVTSVATIPAAASGTADLIARSDGVLAGLVAAEGVFAAVRCAVEPVAIDTTAVAAGDVVAIVRGPLRALLTAERPALNVLTHASGIATLTRRWVDAVAGTKARVRDTRKTLPGLRVLEKYAVRCGGGENHRMSLSDAALIKDNHLAYVGSVLAAVTAVREAFGDLELEVECDSLDQVAAAVDAGADLILLDNFDIAALREAVRLVAGRARLEASGGLSLERARDVAETGVDYLAVGALTHSAPALDLGLDLRV